MPDQLLRTFGAYVHIPFCASRCGYCDFNTYTAPELERDGTTVSPATYADRVIREIEVTRTSLVAESRPLETVFFGGGTPTMLSAADLVRILGALRANFGLRDDAEVTTEANPDSVSRAYLGELHAGGFTRISFGHQSSSTNVLRILERTHTPGRTWEAVRWAREVGFEHVSVDLIYGTPGETDDDLRATLADVTLADVDHVSAYSLIVENGTRLAAQVKRGEVAQPSDDVAAARYVVIDEHLAAHGFTWYEVSNWAKPGGECRHNIGYWHNDDWLGIGPGAHAHMQGTRSWNVKHPAAWAAQIDAGMLAIADREDLSAHDIAHENIMLRLRLHEGLSTEMLSESGRNVAAQAVVEGLLAKESFAQGRCVLTDAGRLLADGLVARLWD